MNIKLTKPCPDCGGRGTYANTSLSYEGYSKEIKCPTCHGTGEVPRYYTPEEFEELTGNKLLDDDRVWIYAAAYQEYTPDSIYVSRLHPEAFAVVHLPFQSAPSPDYRHKESEL